MGVSVNNGIVLITYALQLQHDGVPLREALARAGQRRLRPILMTTLTTIFGLLPLAIGIGEGSELQQALARSVVGGLVTSTIVSLFLIPAMYLVLDQVVRWVRNRREMQPAQNGPQKAWRKASTGSSRRTYPQAVSSRLWGVRR